MKRASLPRLRRRELITLLGSAAAWPLAARAQQPNIPIIGFLSSRSRDENVMAAFQQGLRATGYIDNQNVAIEYRFAEGHYDRLPALVTDLTTRLVAVIAAIGGTPAVLAAKAATEVVPIVFAIGGDPVTSGLVTSLNRPAGNVTGVTALNSSLTTKRVEILHQMVPTARMIGVLINQQNPPSALEEKSVVPAAQVLGLQTAILSASSPQEIDQAFGSMAYKHIEALYVSADPLFVDQRVRVASLAADHAVPAIYDDRDIVEAGGLISYGGKRSDAYQQAGTYVGRILDGEKAGELPIVLATTFELVLNLRAAKRLGILVPPTLLALADQVVD